MKSKITNENQEAIIVIATMVSMIENWEKRKDIVKIADQFIYPHLKDEEKKNKSSTGI